jgi:hypothetical protein
MSPFCRAREYPAGIWQHMHTLCPVGQ